jgi:hypothetical protein
MNYILVMNGRITFPSGAYGTDLPPWDTRYTQQELSALFYGGNPNRNMRFFVAFVSRGRSTNCDTNE